MPLNLRSRGGTGDAERTLDICRRLATDGDDMVVKALSWALRELVVWDPEAVRRFLDAHHDVLAARVRREVRSKHPARRARPDPGSGQPADTATRSSPRKRPSPLVVPHRLGRQAAVHQANGGRAVVLDEVDLDGGALRRHAHAAVLPAVGEDEPPVGDQFHEPADDAGAVGPR